MLLKQSGLGLNRRSLGDKVDKLIGLMKGKVGGKLIICRRTAWRDHSTPETSKMMELDVDKTIQNVHENQIYKF